MKKSYTIGILVVGLLALVATANLQKVSAMVVLDGDGNFMQVLGDSDEKEMKQEDSEKKDDEEKKQEEQKQEENKSEDESQKQEWERKREQEKKRLEKAKEVRIKINAVKLKQAKERIEKKFEDSKEDRERNMDDKRQAVGGAGRSEYVKETKEGEDHKNEKKNEFEREIYKNGVKIKLEMEDGKLVIKKEYEDGRQEKVASDKEFKVEDADGNLKFNIKLKNKEMLVEGKEFAARTNFPLSVNPDTNELVVKTPNKTKVVSVLPDQAVKKILSESVIDDIDPESKTLDLKEYGDDLVYEVKGKDVQRVLGLFKVSIPKTVRVSANTGDIVGVSQSMFTKILDIFSF